MSSFIGDTDKLIGSKDSIYVQLYDEKTGDVISSFYANEAEYKTNFDHQTVEFDFKANSSTFSLEPSSKLDPKAEMLALIKKQLVEMFGYEYDPSMTISDIFDLLKLQVTLRDEMISELREEIKELEELL